MIIYFGLALDDRSHPQPSPTAGGYQYLGPQGLLSFLENHLGLSGHPNDNQYLRIEHYRQALRQYLQRHPSAFFAAAFQADQFATATELLDRRDELLATGWNFTVTDRTPDRLRCLAAIEQALEEGEKLPPGYADRLETLLRLLPHRRHPVTALRLVEPPELLPPPYRRLLEALRETGVVVEPLPVDPPVDDTDLNAFQRALRGDSNRSSLRGDGSLLVLRAQRDTTLAAFLARLLRHNAAFRPVCLVPEKNRTLDLAIVQEGLPSLGIPSASLARPTLQVLKLVTVFLWDPINPFKIMEFVSLAVKPLDTELANRIAEHMAQTPGLMSDSWRFMIRQYFEELESKPLKEGHPNPRQVREQYQFWFERRRYDSSRTVPKEEVTGIFRYLQTWAVRSFDDGGGKNHSLLVLAEQARRIVELLETLPETELTHLELERIVRTIYEPAPVEMQREERHRLAVIHQPHALTGPVDELLWWNFVQNEQEYFFSRWYQPEWSWLAEQDIVLEQPADQNKRLSRQRKHPILQTHRRLVLVLPRQVEGSEVHPHPLFGDLGATFDNLEEVTFDLDRGDGADAFAHFFQLPAIGDLQARRLGRPQPFLRIPPTPLLEAREEETVTSLESLFYYPYQWVFRHKIRLRKSAILSVVKDNTLMGNLAHRFFERLFRQDTRHWDQERLNRWIDEEAAGLLRREGAVLLMYGREPERVNFIKRIKYAAWSLLTLLRANGWEVDQTEKPIEGQFLSVPLKARADLVLKKGEELAVVDLKWRGARRREDAIRNEEDLQLVLYSNLLTGDGQWAHTAFFIMENGRMIARNESAFKDIIAVSPEADHRQVNERILERMQATYQWRMEQIRRGEIEIRCSHTVNELDEHYGAAGLETLEMKSDDAPFDDYHTLINLFG